MWCGYWRLGIGATCVALDLKHQERVPSVVSYRTRFPHEFRVSMEDESGDLDSQERCNLPGEWAILRYRAHGRDYIKRVPKMQVFRQKLLC